ncbi:hypothetical protein NIES4101_62890 [Calothrix sp. NIES-4101]|nr:hypothetical protein NIES4101_62890 [Calothrix sp. NIES-4101]
MKKYSLLSLAIISFSLLISSAYNPVLAENLDSNNTTIFIAEDVTEGQGSNAIDYTVPDTVPAISQPKPNACWATSATMMLGWREQTSYSIEQVMDKAGEKFRKIFDDDTGLKQADKEAFLSALNMTAEAPQSYTVEGLLSLLKKHGSLWVTTDEGSSSSPAIHARIVTGMKGDGTVDRTFLDIIDPADGTRKSESFRNFMGKFEQVASGDMKTGADVRIQVVHF